jgi:hypothetical protein
MSGPGGATSGGGWVGWAGGSGWVAMSVKRATVPAVAQASGGPFNSMTLPNGSLM